MTAAAEAPAGWPAQRRAVVRDALLIGLTSGAYALSFGAIGVAAGLSVLQTCVLSVVLFSGGSQFALVGVLAGGGGPGAAISVSVLLGLRNAFYAVRLAPLLGVRGARRLLAGHFVIDETTAMAVGQQGRPAQRLAFWATGLAIFVLWNLGSLLGALGAGSLADPGVFGLDAAAPAAFVALLRPHLRDRTTLVVGIVGAGVCLAAVPFLPAGVPVLLAAAVAVVAGLLRRNPLPEEEEA